MALEKVIVIKGNTEHAVKSFDDLGATIQEQTDITIEFEKELNNLEQQLKEVGKASFSPQASNLKKKIEGLKGAIKDQKLSLKELNNERKKANKISKSTIENVTRNYGAIQILDQFTGGLATQVRSAADASKLFNINLKATKTALIATGIGAFVVALGLVVAYWEEIIEFIGGANKKLQRQIDLGKKHSENLSFQLEILELQKKSLENQGESTKEIEGTIKRVLDEQIKQLEVTLLQQKQQDEINSAKEIEFSWWQKIQVMAGGQLGTLNLITEEEKTARGERKKGLEDTLKALETLKTRKTSIEKEERDEKAKRASDDLAERWRIYNEETKINEEREKENKRIAEQDKKQREQHQADLDEDEQNEIDREDRRLQRNLENAEKRKILRHRDLADERAVADAKTAIQNSTLDNVANGIFLISQLNEKSKALQAASILADSATGIAKVVINTQAANSGAVAKYSLLPGGQALAAAEIIQNKISAGISIGSNVLATTKALSALGKGGSPSKSDVGGGGGGASAPSFNLVAGTGSNQIAEGLSKQDQPLKAYVVSADVSTAQSLDRNIVKNSSL